MSATTVSRIFGTLDLTSYEYAMNIVVC